MKTNRYLQTGEKSLCCGCMACSRTCPFGAIKMRRDEKGFSYPVLDLEKCKDCGMCQKVCPMEENYVGQDAEPDTYAVCNSSEEVVRKSSSGGMFSLLAEWVISQGGIIYGVEFDEEFGVRHGRATTMEEAARFRTSKYVESDISQVYTSLIQDLEDGKTVLITGTPCQISGVTKHLRLKKVGTEKLYTCDNICHGVPSSKIWRDYLSIIKSAYIKPGDKILQINMRSKKNSWQERMLDIELENGDIRQKIKQFSFNQFFSSMYGQRNSCFHCRYTSYKRPSDFTIGDFWNLENAGISFDTTKGVNALLVNTDKGRELFEKLRTHAKVQPVSKQACWQAHLEYSSKQPAKQEQFWKEYSEAEDKEEILKRYMKGSLTTRIIRKLSPVLQKTGLYGLAGKLYKVVFVGNKNE